MKLHSCRRSMTSCRMRVALDLEGIACKTIKVEGVVDARVAPDCAALNTGRAVPTPVLDDGAVLTRTMAILHRLDDTHREPAALPADPVARVRVRAAARTSATDNHPVNDLRVIGRSMGMGHAQDEAAALMNDPMTGDPSPLARLSGIGARCLALPAFDAGRQEARADAT